jgi:hypothetical protein
MLKIVERFGKHGEPSAATCFHLLLPTASPICFSNTPNQYTFTLKVATAAFAETSDSFQHSTRLNLES